MPQHRQAQKRLDPELPICHVCLPIFSDNIKNKNIHINMTKLNSLPIIEFKTAKTFEDWLEKNYDNSGGFWLKLFKKNLGEKSITYAEALDVALRNQKIPQAPRSSLLT